MPPPGIIFTPGRRATVFVGLQTADHKGLPSPVEKEEGALAACDRARIMRLPVGEEEDSVALVFVHCWWRSVSVVLGASHAGSF